jgi:hypothetical protein
MKTTYKNILALGAGLAMLAMLPGGAAAQSGTAAGAETKAATVQTPRKKAKRTVRRAPARVAPHMAVAAPAPMWRGPDPSFGWDYSAYNAARARGDCVVDLGYGRWEYCGDIR